MKSIGRLLASGALCAAFVFLSASETLAQACMGNPAGERQMALAAGIGFTDGFTSYGGSVAGNLDGPISLAGGFGLIDYEGIDPTGKAISASAGYEVSGLQFSMCPAVGLGYSWVSEEDELSGAEGTVSAFTVPVGVGFGKVLRAGESLYVTPYGIPQLLYIRSEVEASDGVNSFEISDSSAEFGAALGVLLGTGRVYGGGDVSFTTIDNSDPVLSLLVGVIF